MTGVKRGVGAALVISVAPLFAALVACTPGETAREDNIDAFDGADDVHVDLVDLVNADSEVLAEVDVVDPSELDAPPLACSLDGNASTVGFVEVSDDEWQMDFPLHIESGCVQVVAHLLLDGSVSGRWSMHRFYTLCNACDEPMALYWLGGAFQGEAPEEPHDDVPTVDKTDLDLTASLVDDRGVRLPADCRLDIYGGVDYSHVLKRFVLEPGHQQVLANDPFGLCSWNDRCWAGDFSTKPYYANPIDYTSSLSIELQVPRFWPLSTPIEQIVPEQQGDIACVVAGLPIHETCPTSLDDFPWSSASLNVVRVDNVVWPPGVLEYLSDPDPLAPNPPEP